MYTYTQKKQWQTSPCLASLRQILNWILKKRVSNSSFDRGYLKAVWILLILKWRYVVCLFVWEICGSGWHWAEAHLDRLRDNCRQELFSYFSHCCGQVSDKEQFYFGEVYFGSWLDWTCNRSLWSLSFSYTHILLHDITHCADCLHLISFVSVRHLMVPV